MYFALGVFITDMLQSHRPHHWIASNLLFKATGDNYWSATGYSSPSTVPFHSSNFISWIVLWVRIANTHRIYMVVWRLRWTDYVIFYSVHSSARAFILLIIAYQKHNITFRPWPKGAMGSPVQTELSQREPWAHRCSVGQCLSRGGQHLQPSAPRETQWYQSVQVARC